MFLYLVQKSLPCILRKIKIVSEFLHYLIRIIIFENFYFFYVLPVKFNFEDTDRFLYNRQKAIHWAAVTNWWGRQWLWYLWLHLFFHLRRSLWLGDLVAPMGHWQVHLRHRLRGGWFECALFLLLVKLYILWVFVFALMLFHIHVHCSLRKIRILGHSQRLLVKLWLILEVFGRVISIGFFKLILMLCVLLGIAIHDLSPGNSSVSECPLVHISTPRIDLR